ncbi:MAG TPA: restriction endonuclease subunit S, partial [Nitrososphaera sp.]|nr:restriction endonuclease subunit S [Nitrososphaera sp.]
ENVALAQRIILLKAYKKKIANNYLKYHFASSFGKSELWSNATGSTALGIKADRFYATRLLVPLLEEQEAITTFLDRKTAELDELIQLKERQIELLGAKRQALISHAVTRGLDPSVKLRPSGIEWLGEIPAHWQVTRLKFIAQLQTGLTLGKEYKDRETVTRPYLRVANVQDGFLDLETITTISVPEEEAAKCELKSGDVLMTEGGDLDKLGRGHLWAGQIEGCLHQNHIFAVRPDQAQLDSLYLSYLMASWYGKNYFTSTGQQTTNLATTNSTKLMNFPLLLPPLQEQKVILERLGQETRSLDRVMQTMRSQVDKLREYRQALISAAVTGKIDVRGV